MHADKTYVGKYRTKHVKLLIHSIISHYILLLHYYNNSYCNYTIYTTKNIFQTDIFLMIVLDTPSCYERAARGILQNLDCGLMDWTVDWTMD